MKPLNLVATAIAAACAFASVPAFADHHEGVGKEFAMMDTDQDGKVSLTELAGGAKVMFAKMDVSGD